MDDGRGFSGRCIKLLRELVPDSSSLSSSSTAAVMQKRKNLKEAPPPPHTCVARARVCRPPNTMRWAVVPSPQLPCSAAPLLPPHPTPSPGPWPHVRVCTQHCRHDRAPSLLLLLTPSRPLRHLCNGARQVGKIITNFKVMYDGHRSALWVCSKG